MPSLIVDMGSRELFAQGWPQTMILLIPTSQVAGIVGVNHGTWQITDIFMSHSRSYHYLEILRCLVWFES
jgi:hypothetical protein